MLGVLAIVAAAPGQARAQAAPSGAEAALAAARARIADLPDAIVAAYFQSEGGAPVADAYGGAFQLFTGEAGAPGAIVWSPSSGARLTYGAIFDFYRQNGREEQNGYPRTDVVQGAGESFDCPADTVAYQVFMLRPPTARFSVTYALCASEAGVSRAGRSE